MSKETQSEKIPASETADEADAIEVKTAPELGADPVSEPEPAEAQPEPADDPELEAAVDDIAAQESDEVLAAEDEQAIATVEPKLKHGRLKTFLTGWLRNSGKRRALLIALVIVLLVVIVTPSSRYFVLNTAGVRSSASLVVLDDGTQQPLKNVEVTLGDQQGVTDKTGAVYFKELRLGSNKLVMQKRAFETKEQVVTIGWGSNPLEPKVLKPVGSQYRFVVTDYLSEKPLSDVEIVTGEASALSNAEGEITLTLETTDEEPTTTVTIAADGYRTENLTLNLDTQAVTELQLVPAKAHVFISKRSGRYDVYKIDADGQNEEKVLAGSGVERDDLVLAAHPTKDFAALVSTRENVRKNGYLLSTLTLIDVTNKTPSKVAQSERVQIVDWVGDRLVYVQIAAGASADDPQRHRLMSYDLASGQSKELAAANYFNDVLAIGNYVYYAPSATYSDTQAVFYRVQANGDSRQTILNEEVWNVYRTAYNKLVLVGDNRWHEYEINANKITLLNGEPGGLASRVYVNSPDGKHSLWVDQRDGKGVLLSYDVDGNSDSTLQDQSGLNNPVHWLSNHAVVFRIATSQETADYVMSLNGGQPKKIKDVTNTSGVDRWYYY